jgi:hypothetical protein
MLIGVQDVSFVRENEVGNRRHNAFLVRAFHE